jgi:hypothetical protein
VVPGHHREQVRRLELSVLYFLRVDLLLLLLVCLRR